MLDSLGRDVGDIKSNVQAIKTQMLQDIGKSVKASGTDSNNEVLNKIAKQLETIVGYKLDDELKKFNQALDTIADGAKELIKNKNKSKQQAKDAARAMGNDPTARAALSLLKKIAANQVGGGTGSAKPIPGQPRAISSINSSINMMGKLFQNMNNFFKRNKGIIAGPGGGGGGGKGGARPVASGDEDDYSGRGRGKGKKEKETFLQKSNRFGRAGGGALGGLLTADNPTESLIAGLTKMISGGLNKIPIVGGFLSGFLDSILKPITEELEYFRAMSRSIVVNYGTGLDSVKNKLEEVKITETDSFITGQSRTVLLKEQVKLYRRGITEAKSLQKVLRTSLLTANLIDADAGSTAEMFADWNQHLGASEHQLSMMGRGLIGIGRQTGLTGENLLQVAKSSADFMKNMRLAGTFSGSAANNIMGLMAQAQKTGTTAGMGRLAGGLTGGLLGNSTDERTKSLLMRAGAMGGVDPMKLMSGVGTDKASMMGVANGLERIIKQYTGGRDISRMSKQERGIISQIMEADTGFKLEELNLTAKNMREASKSFDQQLADVADKLKKDIYKPEEAQTLRQGILFNQAAETIEKFNGALETASPELKGAFDQQVEIINARLQKVSPGASFSRNAGESNETLLARINKVDQEVFSMEQNVKDPARAAETAIHSMENMMREYLQELIQTWMPRIAALLIATRDWLVQDGRKIFDDLIKTINEWIMKASGWWEDVTGALGGFGNTLKIIGITVAVGGALMLGLAALNAALGVGGLLTSCLALAGAIAGPLGLAIGGVLATLAVKNKAEETAQGNRDAQGRIAKSIGDFMADFVGDTSRRQSVIGNMDMAAVDKEIMERQKNIASYDEQIAKIPKSFSGWDRIMGRAKTWQDDLDAMGKAKQTEGDILGELRGQKSKLLIANMSPEEIADAYNKAQKGETFQIPGMGPITGEDIPGIMQILKEKIENKKKISAEWDNNTSGGGGDISPALPGVNVDEEIKKRQIAIDNSNAEIEANTSDTAANTRQTNVLLGTLLNVISRSARRRGADTPIAGEDVDDSVFFDQFIDVDWVDTIARMVGNTWAQGNPGKHN